MPQSPLLAVGPLVAILSLSVAASSCEMDLMEDEYVETSSAELEWTAGSRLVVVNSRGDLEIVERPGDTIHLEARKRVNARSEEMEREIASEIRVDAIQEGGTLRLEVTYPEGLSNSRVIVLGKPVRRRHAMVDLRLSMPPGVPIRMETRSGDFRTERYEGSLDFSSSSGDVYIDLWKGDCLLTTRSGDASILRIDGSLRMSSASGDLSGEEITNDLDFTATSGDVQLERVGGRLLLSTASGDVEVDRVGGGLDLRTTSGDILIGVAKAEGGVETSGGDVRLGLREPNGAFEVRTGSGDVSLRLATGYPGKLEAKTASGTIDAVVNITVDQANRNRLAGRLGPGTQSLLISTASGDIDVHEADWGGEL